MKRPFVQCLRSVYAHGRSVAVLCSGHPSCLPKGSQARDQWWWPFGRDKDRLESPSCKGKVEVRGLVRKREKTYAEVARSKSPSSVHEAVKKENEICATVAVAPQPAEAMAAARRRRSVPIQSISIGFVAGGHGQQIGSDRQPCVVPGSVEPVRKLQQRIPQNWHRAPPCEARRGTPI